MVHGLIAVNLSLLLVTIFLHYTNLVHFPALITYYHLFDLFIVLYFILTSIHHIRRGKTEEKLLLLGIFLLAGCFAYDILIFNIAKYMDGRLSGLMGISAWGGIAFIICMLFSYATYVYRGITSHIEKATLLRLAYSDNLTGLANRTRFMEQLNDLVTADKKYTVISFDLNNLKYSNDTLGHSNGDNLLCAFADVLKDTFSRFGTVSRIGGDEFSVLLPGCDRTLMNQLMDSYHTRIREENQKGYPFPVSAAWGIAYSDEYSAQSYMHILNAADQRMYDKKAAMKD